MKYASPLLALAALTGAAPAPAPVPRAAAPRLAPYEGVWRNTHGTVEIRTSRCGAGLCGRVVRASPEAEEKAAAGGGGRLVGQELFRNLSRGDDGLWYGAVYVPDLGREVDGTIEQTGPDQLTATGCLLAGIGCKVQVWTRVR